MAQKLKDLVSKGVLVETSQADWASAIVVVRKADGNIRICGDFRDLNWNLVSDKYLIPAIEELMTKMEAGNR